MLNRQGYAENRTSVGLDSVSATGDDNNLADSGSAPYTPTSGGASAFSYLPGASQAGGHTGSTSGGIVNLKTLKSRILTIGH